MTNWNDDKGIVEGLKERHPDWYEEEEERGYIGKHRARIPDGKQFNHAYYTMPNWNEGWYY